MRSAEDVKLALLAHLQTLVPARCAAIAAETGKPCDPPALWKAAPARVPGPSEWPAAYIDEVARSVEELSERTSDGDPAYLVRWDLAIEVWHRAPARDDRVEALGLRARLERALIEVLLDQPKVAAGLVVAPTSLDVDYSPTFEVTQGFTASALELRASLHSRETIPRLPLADPLDDVEVTVTKLAAL